MSGTVPSNGRYVPMDLYLEDRRELRDWMRALSSDVKAMRSELDRDDGREVAEEAADRAVTESRRSKREIARDAGLCIFSAALAVGVHLITTAATGG